MRKGEQIASTINDLRKHVILLKQHIHEQDRETGLLRKIADQWRSVFDAINDPVCVSNMEGEILRCNRAMSLFLQKPFSEIIGQKCRDTVYCNFQTECDILSDRLRATGRRQSETARRDHHWYEIIVDPLFNVDGTLNGAVHILKDISEKRNLENQLQQSQKMEAINRLAGQVAHDFNNFLMIILGNTEMILESREKKEFPLEMLKNIYETTERAIQLNRQLLTFCRRQSFEPIPVQLNDLLRTLIRNLSPLMGEDINCLLETCDDLKTIKADPSQIEQIILNLMINAKEAMPRGGRLYITTENRVIRVKDYELEPGDYVTLTIQDTGTGMPPDIMERIFDPFYTTKESGTGLGLSTVYGIIEQLKGKIHVTSEVNSGTCFEITFPVLKDKAGRTEPEVLKREVKIQPGKETVLVVDDDQSVCRLLETILSRLGYKVLRATHAGEALDTARSCGEKIDLLLVDVVLPDRPGPELARELKRTFKELKVLYISGYADDRTSDPVIMRDRDHFLNKPFTIQSLARRVRHILDKDNGG